VPGLPSVLEARRSGVLQSEGQARPLQPQLCGGQGASRGYTEGQREGLSIAEPLVSQELLCRPEKKAVTILPA
jgi:hypothetical protein